jgi:hypothetical protein
MLQDRLSLDNKISSKLVQTMPFVFGYSIEYNLEPKLAWVQERLSLANQSLRKLV